MHLAEKLRELRRQRGLTQKELAEASGVVQEALEYFEQGRRSPRWDDLYRLAKTLKVSADVFMECLSAAGKPLPKRAQRGPGRPRKGAGA